MELKVCFLGAVRRRTFICCRNVRISASSAARDRNRSTTIQTMSLTRSLIPQQHRPILDQLLVRLSLRQGQGHMSKFKRGLRMEAFLGLEQLTNSQGDNWWRELLRHWAPSGCG